MRARIDLRSWRVVAVVGTAICLVLGFAAASAAAAETFTFNPTLSLTGGCTTAPVDEVPDPGCPGGSHPPLGGFASPASAGTDGHGDIYVASQLPFATARVDVFSPTATFLTELQIPRLVAMAVDPEGVVYALIAGPTGPAELLAFRPTVYRPEQGEITYSGGPTVLLTQSEGLRLPTFGLAVDPEDEHLLVIGTTGGVRSEIREFGSAAEGNPALPSPIPSALLEATFPLGPKNYLAVGEHHEIYVPIAETVFTSAVVEVFAPKEPAVEGSEYELARTINGANTPNGKFGSNGATSVSVAVDDETGNVFVNDIGTSSASPSKKVVYEFSETGEYLATIKPPAGSFEAVIPNAQIAIDNGAGSPNRGDLLVPSSEKSPGHMLVFEPVQAVTPPAVESFELSGITRGEASMSAKIKKNGSAVSYRFEFTTLSQYEAVGFDDAAVAGTGTLNVGFGSTQVSAVLTGLPPGGRYVARVVVQAVGCEETGCEAEVLRPFATYPEGVAQGFPCANAAHRVGASGALPDCRAYELVSPSDTGGHQLVGPVLSAAASRFGTPVATANGESVAFTATGGSIPGLPGVGSLYGSAYVAQRGGTGWSTVGVEPSSPGATLAFAGALSPDHTISTESVQEGTMQLEEQGSAETTQYVRRPDGSFELVGKGSLGIDPTSSIEYISPTDNRLFFRSGGINRPAQQLEPDAPPAGTSALYERGPDGATHTISVLPNGALPVPGAALTSGAFSLDGSVVTFRYGPVSENPLYVRVDGSETLEAGPAGAEIEGVSASGASVFYLLDGDLYRFDVGGDTTEQIVGSGDAIVVNVAESGDAIYFISPSVLDGGANPVGNFAEPGKQNLYRWRPGSIRFVAQVTQRDVTGESLIGEATVDGLGLWQESLQRGEPAIIPDKTTQAGNILLFESRAPVTGYESKASATAPEGEAELYRYDAAREELTCVSCDPTEQRPTGSASLLSLEIGFFPRNPMSIFSIIPNLSEDGNRVVFQSPDALVPEDTNETQDVYEWEASGTGSCAQVRGCLALLSSGTSSEPSFLFGASTSGDDAFLLTSDRLTRSDQDAAASIYDARVGGGFAEPTPTPACEGEGCRPPLSSAPNLAAPSTASVGASGNVPATKPAPKKNQPHKKKHKKKRHKKKQKANGKKTKKKKKQGGKR